MTGEDFIDTMAEIIEERQFRNRTQVFEDRRHAGKLLASMLRDRAGDPETFLLAIPAGGVPVTVVVAQRLHLPFDLVLTRKLHVPWNPEAGFGAVSWNGVLHLNEPLVARLGLTQQDVEDVVAKEQAVITRRLNTFRGARPFPPLQEKCVIIIDDGLASGFSMLTTIHALKRIKVKEMTVAVPTAPTSAIQLIQPHVQSIVCLNIRSGYSFAVAHAYKAWHDLTDDDVIALLDEMEMTTHTCS
jgi:predicted phosphoribosyltransferase